MTGATGDPSQRELADDPMVGHAEALGHLPHSQRLSHVQVAQTFMVDPRVWLADAGLRQPPPNRSGRRSEHRTQLALVLAVGNEAAQLGVVYRASQPRFPTGHTSGGERLGDALTADAEVAGDLLLRRAGAVQAGDGLGIRIALLPPSRERTRAGPVAGGFGHLSIKPHERRGSE